MAKTYAKGVDGKFYFAGKKAVNINSWNMSMAGGVENVTDFESSGVEREPTGVVDVTGSFSGQYVWNDTTVQETIMAQFVSGGTHAKGIAKFIESSLQMYFGNVIITDVSKDQTAEGLQTFSANFVGDGRLTLATSTST